MTLDDLIAADAQAFSTTGHDLAESVEFYPDGSVGTAVTIQATVFRQEPTVEENIGRTFDAELLIARSELALPPTKISKVSVAVQFGEPVEVCRVTNVNARDSGFYLLEVTG